MTKCRTHLAGIVPAARAFQFGDLRAQVGKNRARKRAGQHLAQLKDTDAGQWFA